MIPVLIKFSRWKKCFTIMPHRCHVSSKLIWFRFGYTARSYNILSRETKIYWRDANTLIIEVLKGAFCL
jgi:hypothetical protein